jgi:signal transduction histidine kinase/ActR/RegA family two-component response regulator
VNVTRLTPARARSDVAEPDTFAARIALLERRLARAEKARAAAEALLEKKSRILAKANAELEARKEDLLADLGLRTRQLLEAQRVAGFGTVIWDVQARRLEVSRQVQVLFGISHRHAFVGHRQLIRRVHAEDRASVIHWLYAELAGNRHPDRDHFIEFRALGLGRGRPCRWLRAMAQIQLDDAGQPSLILGTIQDVTRQNEAAEDAAALRRREQEQLADLQRLNIELTHARENAERANAAKSRFLAMMSHDIRTPLNGVIGMLDLMSEDTLSAEQLRTLALARSSGQQLRVLLDDIIDLARAEAGRFKLNLAPADLVAVLSDGASFWRQVASEKRLNLEAVLEPSLPAWALVDRVRLRQLIDNLLSNAIKYTPTGGVTLRARYGQDQRLRVEVLDTGVGVPPHRRVELFDEFRQLQLLGSEPGGAGLGLAICRRIVDVMQGAIGVEAASPGSCFWFEIPCRVIDTPGTVQAPRVQRLTTIAGEKPRILVAEDIETNRIVVEGHLRRLGCEVALAHDGLAAVDAAAAGGFDLVLMDMAMPRMDGAEAARAIRALSGPPGQIPIVALTAFARPEELAPMMEAGAIASASKPIVLADLYEVWRSALASATHRIHAP